jgi:hypothetical protein
MNFPKALKSQRNNARKAVDQSREAVDQLRAMRHRLLDERRDVERRPRPLEEAKAAAEQDVQGAVKRALDGLNLAPLMRPAPGREPGLRLDDRDLHVLAFAASADAIGAALTARLEDEYASEAEPLTAAEKSAELDRIDDEILAAELAEEGVVRELEAAGFEILRRPDADPRALLAAASELE